MFEVHCPQHGCRVLLAANRIHRVANTDAGIVVSWRCWCGHLGTSTTGVRASRSAARPDAA